MKKTYPKESLELMSKDLSKWRGVFYANKKDPRLIVPKLTPSLGWTFNFGNIYAYIVIIGLIGVIVASQFFLK